MLNLDTHILLLALGGELTQRESKLLSLSKWGISSIVFWEISKLHEKGRISIGLDHPLLVQKLSQVHVWDISRDVCLSLRLLDFNSDPADELIAATSIAYAVPLMTRDARILSSRVINFAS